MAYRYNPPPNWPAPPAGWAPTEGWQPDPSWGPPPAGWVLWELDRMPATKVIGDPTEETLWEGVSQTLAAAATGGKAAPSRYRLTPRFLYFERGVVSTKSQQIALNLIRDVDLKQSIMQKARGIGDVLVHMLSNETVAIDSVKDHNNVRDMINRAAVVARSGHMREQATTYVQGGGQPHYQVPQASQPTPQPVAPDIMGQLRQLGELKSAGVLTDAEFESKKADLLSRM